ncbi:MAG: acyl-CoA dehydratase activase [Deltaproteobacteria bacterium]|jgi:predicted CoA-substrate-specific enzyme activase|nr:acyl-CoA dehydratase activase [Deltaproteobacteria bacterium]
MREFGNGPAGALFPGLDIGSVSVKLALADRDGRLLESLYLRHCGRPFHALLAALETVLAKYPAASVHAPRITGSSAALAAELLKGAAVGEVTALTVAARETEPRAKALIDIGGEDTKVLWFSGGGAFALSDFAMNALCAAGTGSFLDQQAHRLGFGIADFGALALKSEVPPRVAGRCSVFAKSDMIHLQQSATPDYEIIYGLCLAMARSIKSGLAKGRGLEPPVLFTGGVAANPGLMRALKEILALEGDGQLVAPEAHFVFGALGAAALGRAELSSAEPRGLDLSALKAFLDSPREPPRRQPRLSRRAQKPRQSAFDWSSADPENPMPVYVGVDVGSVSTNVALVREDGLLCARVYVPTAGRPLEAITLGFSQLPPEAPGRVKVLGVCTTGSGRYLSADFIGADMTVNEITAQATAAVAIDPEVDTIFEIGGQDSKYISLSDGVITDFMMNKACAAGTGSFLEEQADKLGLSIKGEFGDRALSAENPVHLGERCTVFMESDLVHHQQNGVNLEDLTAGLCHGIVANYLGRVVETRKVGDRVFFQGGTSFNEGVAAAFESRLGRPVTVPDNADVTGAVGAAMIARDRRTWKESAFAGFDLSKRPYEIKSFECRHCANRCEIRKVTVAGGRPFFYGSRCDRWEEDGGEARRAARDVPDLFEFRSRLCFGDPDFGLCGYGDGPGLKPWKGTAGLVRTMFFAELGPFFSTFLAALGFKPVWSSPTNKSSIHKGCERTLGEFCFPIKSAHGHILELAGMGLDHVFLPSLVNMPAAPPANGELAAPDAGAGGGEGPGGNGKGSGKGGAARRSPGCGPETRAPAPDNAACPYAQSLAFTAPAALDLKEPFLVRGPVFFGEGEKPLLDSLCGIARKFGASRGEAARALKLARAAQESFQKKLVDKGREALAALPPGRTAIVVVARPYNGFDPGLNLRLNEKLAALGVLGVPMDFLPLGFSGDEPAGHYWRYGQNITRAAEIVAARDDLEALYISNFGCGPDSFILHFFRNILGPKPFLEIEIDEHSSDVGAVTRLEAFLDSLAARKARGRAKAGGGPAWSSRLSIITGPRRGQTIYLPPMCDHTRTLAAALRAAGLDAEALPPSDGETVELGRSQTSGKECYPLILTVGDFLKLSSRPGFDPAKSALFMPSSNGPCRFGQYSRYTSLVFKRLGLSEVEVLSLDQTGGMYDRLDEAGSTRGGALSRDVWRALASVDILQKALFRSRPRERARGAADAAYGESLSDLERAFESGSVPEVKKALARSRERFHEALDAPWRALPGAKGGRGPSGGARPGAGGGPGNGRAAAPRPLPPSFPAVGLVGEIYVRSNDFANEEVIRRLEALGAEIQAPPFCEWILYTGFVNNMRARRGGHVKKRLKTRLTLMVQDWELSRLASAFDGFFPGGAKEPPVSEVVKLGENFLDRAFQGEAILSLGKAVEMYRHGARGVVNIMPFTCMPGMVVGGLSTRLRELCGGLPLLNLAFDGQSQTNTQARLEAFMYQVSHFANRFPRREA